MQQKRVGVKWLVLFTIAWLLIWTAQLTPLQLHLPLQFDTSGDGDDWVCGVVIGALLTLLARERGAVAS